jgi:inosine triphosphate pyrophosphatase
LFEGRTEGTIVPARGPKIFGWDAVFEPLGTGLTYTIFVLIIGSWKLLTFDDFLSSYAEMPDDQKNKLSHRYKALEKLRTYLHSLP